MPGHSEADLGLALMSFRSQHLSWYSHEAPWESPYFSSILCILTQSLAAQHPVNSECALMSSE